MNHAHEIEQLTEKLVHIASINGTKGESEIGDFIASYIQEIPYFKEHPEFLFVKNLKQDVYNRKNVFAFIQGKQGNETILFHGHTDTVGVKDFGDLTELAFSPKQLKEALRHKNLPKEIMDDVQSKDYMFGRGCCDMKSGDAVFLILLKEFSHRADQLNGNLLFSFNPVEENTHQGMIEGLDFLKQIKQEKQLTYKMAINNDYICPLFPGDHKKYIYTGAVGKILPCFYIQGKETHVGQCFEGVDASFLAALLIEKINENPEFCDGYEGEYTLPPSVLKMKDQKDWYNVQTAKSAFLYFNYFIHHASIEEIMKKLQSASHEVLETFEQKVDDRYKAYCELSNIVYHPYRIKKEVYTYEQLWNLACKSTEDEAVLQNEVTKLTQNEKEQHTDAREIGRKIVEHLLKRAQITNPCIVLFFAPPYCPHNTLAKENASELKLKDEIKKVADEIGETYQQTFQLFNFFPSLSDSSYLKLDDDDRSIQLLLKNFPEQKTLYPIPFDAMKALNIPAFNFGCYGKDAHKWTERVYKPYSFEVLPDLLEKTILHFLG